MQYRRISADCHLDLPWLPPELFVENARRALKDRMPYVEEGPDGPRWVTRAGINMGLLGGVGSGGGKFIFGILGVASRLEDHEAANEMLRIYNDWLKQFCSHYPDRQLGLACLPYGDIDEAVKEIHRDAPSWRRGGFPLPAV